MLTLEVISDALSPRKNFSCRFRFFRGLTAPENFTGQIKKFRPTHLVIIDAADFGIRPGQIRMVLPEEISGASFSTHTIPLNVLLDYLATSMKFEPVVLGIQPKNVDFNSPISKEVSKAVTRLARTFQTVFMDKFSTKKSSNCAI